MELEDTFIPKLREDVVYRKLAKLTLDQLCEVILKWFRKFGGGSHGEDIKLGQVETTVRVFQTQKVNKKTVISRIMYVYWPDGLNVYQLAELDCVAMMQRSKEHKWKSKYMINPLNEKTIGFMMDPKNFKQALNNEVSKLHLTHMFLCKHTTLPVIVVRIQSYETNNSFLSSVGKNGIILNLQTLDDKLEKSQNDDLISRKPFYIVFALNCPFIIHSSQEDSYTQYILDCVTRILSQRDPMILKDRNNTAITSLEKILILDGPSRFGNSMGLWSKYAEGKLELTPLGDIEKHESYKGRKIIVRKFDEITEDDENPELKRLRKEKNMIRFKGSKDGIVNQKILEIKKSLTKIHALDDRVSRVTLSKYTSLVPTRKVEFKIIRDEWKHPDLNDDIDLEIIDQQAEFPISPSIKISMKGNDVFGGLHQLCDQNLINVDKIPGYLTGENGLNSGVIINGEFVKVEAKKSGLI